MPVTLSRDMPRITGGTSVTVTNGSATVTGIGLSSLWQSTVGDRITKNFGRGSFFRFRTNQPVMIAACVDDDELTLMQPWAGSTDTHADYEIVNPTLNSSAQVADQVDALLRRGDPTSPFTSFTVDGGAARMKLAQSSGLAALMVGTTGGGDGGLLDALTVDPATKIVDFPRGTTQSNRNLLMNGGLQVWQRGTSFTASGYTADRVYSTITGTLTVARYASGAPLGAQYYISATSGADGATVSHVMGFENNDTVPLRNRKLTASCRVYRGAAWSGGDVTLAIETRTAGTDLLFTGTWTVLASATLTPTGSPQTLQVTGDTTAVAAMTGLRIRISHASGLTNTHVLYVGAIKLEYGPTATPLILPQFIDELVRCQRYFFKTYAENVAPATAPHTANYVGMYSLVASATGWPFGSFRYPTQMRTNPTLVFYNPNDANTTNPVRNFTGSTDHPLSTSGVGNAGFHSKCNASVALGNIVGFHFTADAELG